MFDEYIKHTDNSYILKKGFAEALIPLSFFESTRGFSTFVNEKILTFGIFYLYIWESEDDRESDTNYTKCKQMLFKLPAKILMAPSYVEKSPDGYKLLFNTGDKLLEEDSLIQDAANVENVLDIIYGNYLPQTIEYGDILSLLLDACNLNGISLKSPNSIAGFIISELCRNPKDDSENFRSYLFKNENAKETDRKMVSLTSLTGIVSTFGALGSGNPNMGVTRSINRERFGTNNPDTVLETVVKE